eukprot:gnl/TRDRNA2_/TRDRNA2_197101_c0_seq1.p2 gnl/TRDRNA2_/TRDRNA2_197101_c0~~gnl/TRDRNA2_/TRDRNA2_197101_c0_seq1.p2  ORF type:complete len:123 (-),score=4.53 gnl/TRDRNA2_/TRDRNA2_197101_c0_seq1:216-584(-)
MKIVCAIMFLIIACALADSHDGGIPECVTEDEIKAVMADSAGPSCHTCPDQPKTCEEFNTMVAAGGCANGCGADMKSAFSKVVGGCPDGCPAPTPEPAASSNGERAAVPFGVLVFLTLLVRI